MLRFLVYCLFLGCLVYGLSARSIPTPSVVMNTEMTETQVFAGLEIPEGLNEELLALDQSMLAMEELKSHLETKQLRGLSSLGEPAPYNH